jgi:ParB family chromosome partitioning protein
VLVAGLQNKGGATSSKKAPLQLEAHIASLRDKLQERFGTKVTLRYQKGRGAIEIQFFNDADLERILNVAGVPPEST